MRAFWWAEFQKRGALHYHAIVVDVPFETLREARHWFDAHWVDADGNQLAGIQTYVEWRSAAWFKQSAGNYVLKDVRKISGKRYEQDYERMPRGWRTFRSHQLAFVAAEHKEHDHQAHTACLAPPEANWYERSQWIYVYRFDHHVPAAGGCRLTRRRQRKRPPHKTRRDVLSASVSLPGTTAPLRRNST